MPDQLPDQNEYQKYYQMEYHLINQEIPDSPVLSHLVVYVIVEEETVSYFPDKLIRVFKTKKTAMKILDEYKIKFPNNIFNIYTRMLED